MSSKIRRSIDFEPEDLEWITRVVEERKKEDPAYSRNILVAEAIAALKEKLEGDEMNMEEFAQHLGFVSERVLLEDASEIAVVEGDISWYITRMPDGRWAAWDDSELSEDRVSYFDTREEAVTFHRQGFDLSGLSEDAWQLEIPTEKVLVGDPDTDHYFLRDASETATVQEGWEIIHGTFFPKEGKETTGIFKSEDGLFTPVEKGEAILRWSEDPLNFLEVGEKWKFGKTTVSVTPEGYKIGEVEEKNIDKVREMIARA